MRLTDLPQPDTAATRAAGEVLRRYAGPALAGHAVRSWLWAAALGTAEGIPYDPELLQVAALLHDLGLEEPFDSVRVPFEHAGGAVAWVFGAGAGWAPARRDRLAGAIVAHMADAVDPAADPEGYLLERATALDISGRGAADWPEPFRAEVLAAWPRLDLVDRFARCFAGQAARKPLSAAGAAVRSGLLRRLAANPLEALRGDLDRGLDVRGGGVPAVRGHQPDLQLRLGRRADGQPAHVVEGEVGADLEAEHVPVEGEGGVLVGDEEEGVVHGELHVAKPAAGRSAGASPNLLSPGWAG